MRRLTGFPVLLYFSVALAIPLLIAAGSYWAGTDRLARDGKFVTGDYPAYLTGAEIVHRGQGARLYDMALQREVQRELTGEPVRLMYLTYPPGFPFALAPLAALPRADGFRVYGLCCAALFCATLALLRPVLPTLGATRSGWIVVALGFASFHPTARSIVGGGNAILTLGCVAGIYAAYRRGFPLLAGLCLGLLSYKPQFCLLLGLVFLVRGDGRVVAGALGTVALHYLLGAWLVGPRWPLELLAMIAAMREVESAGFFYTHFSIVPSLQHSLPAALALPLAALGVTAVVGSLLALARRYQAGDAEFPLFFGFLLTGNLLAMPHLQFYEAALLPLVFLLVLERDLSAGRETSLRLRLAMLAIFAGFPLYKLSEELGVQPLFLVLVGTHLWLGARLWSASRALCEAVELPPAGPAGRSAPAS